MKQALAALAGTFLLMGAGAAVAADWRLTEVSGRVRVTAPGEDPKAGAPNLMIPAGADITTAGGARAVLTNGEKRIVIGPNSRMTVAAGQPAGMTRIMQDLGSIVFQVDKQAKPHFRVDTPLLAAVVKGTTFTVSVGAVSDTVHVAEGLVEVRANAGGQPNDIPSGVTGRVSREAPDQVGVTAPAVAAAPEPAAQILPALDYSQVSDGVVAGPETAPGRGLGVQPTVALAAEGPMTEPLGAGDSALALASASVAAMAQSAAPSAGSGGLGTNPGEGAGPPTGAPAGPSENGGNGNGPPASVPGGPGVNNGNGDGPPASVPAGPGANNGNGDGPPTSVPAGPGANNGAGDGPPASVPAGPGANNGNGPPASVPTGPGANNGAGDGPPVEVPAGPDANNGGGQGAGRGRQP